jgi:hypothetical protein
MQFRFALPLAAALAMSATALAQDAPPRYQMNPQDMARRHDLMCTGMYAHAVGRLAALEVELKLTSTQKPLFERWKDVKLAGAKAHSAKCAGMTIPPDRNLSIIEARKHQIAMLETHLADLKAEMPSLEALVNSLDKNQQQILMRAGMHAMHQRMEGMEHMMDRHRGGWRDGGMRRGDMPTPPPEH